MRRLIAAALFALTACGSSEKSATVGGTTYTNEKDGTATITSKNGSIRAADGQAAANTAMPDYAPLYPGAKIQSAFTTESAGKKRTMVNITTSDGLDKVAQFYRDKFKAVGMTLKTDMITASSVMISAEQSELHASVIGGPDEDSRLNQFVVTF